VKRLRRTLALGLVVLLVSCSLAVDLSELDEGCGSGKKLCDGVCVSSDDPDKGCGRSGCQPCALPRATPICAADGSCAIAACIGSYENCDDEPENGCEIDLDTDLEHCGSCDARPCVVDNAEPACGSGSCAIRRCNTGFRDCDRMTRNGCEIDTTTDGEHCGACNTPCATDQECADSECVTP
jgi:hypothetical protein